MRLSKERSSGLCGSWYDEVSDDSSIVIAGGKELL